MHHNRLFAGLLALLMLPAVLEIPSCTSLRLFFPEEKITQDVWAPGSEEPNRFFTYTAFDEATAGRLTELSDAYGATAVQIALLDGTQITTYCHGLANRATGREVTDETKYRVASLSKLVAAMTFMAARDRGFVDENTDISDYFGEPCRSPHFPDAVITPSLLMTHTAALDDADYFTYRSGLLSGDGIYLYTRPGAVYYYSNVGYGVLSCLLEHATDRSFNAMAREYIFAPLGIDASYVYGELENSSDVGAIYGEDGGLSVEALSYINGNGLKQDLTLACGNLIINAKDYVKILGVMMHDGFNVDGTQVLSADAVNAMLQLRFSEEHFGVAYGSQIQTNVIEGQTVYVHTGSAYGMYSAFVFDPVSNKAAVALTVGEPRYMDPESEVYYLCQDMLREIWGAGKAR